MRTTRTSPICAIFGCAFTAALVLSTAAAAQLGNIGLSAVRAQRFGNEDLLFYVPEVGDHFAWALAVGDFNNDGADDLATGAPFDDNLGGFHPDSGIVVVRYGLPGAGLAGGLAGDVLSQMASGSPDPADDGDRFGWVLAACDFNDDGFDDLAVGIPHEDHLGQGNAGAVQLHYGSSSGLPAAGAAFYTQSTPGIPGDVEAGDSFGWTLACGDFDNDGFDDAAIGVPFEVHDGENPPAGVIEVVPGSSIGLVPEEAYTLDQDSPGMLGASEFGDVFGWALAVGDFNGDLYDDLAIGVPGEDTTSSIELGKGAVHVVFGGSIGLTPVGNLLRTETAVGGLSESGDQFGFALGAGDFDGDLFDDLAIGVPFEDFGIGGSVPNTGQVNVLYGAAGGFDFGRTQFWAEDNILGAGTSESNDKFGYALAAGDFDADGRSDLVVGHPGEFGLVPDDGAATIVMGSPTGLTAARYRGIEAGHGGFPGPANQASRDYGSSLAVGDFDGDGHVDLTLGAPWENENGLLDVGAEMVLYGSLFADGFGTATTQLWSSVAP